MHMLYILVKMLLIYKNAVIQFDKLYPMLVNIPRGQVDPHPISQSDDPFFSLDWASVSYQSQPPPPILSSLLFSGWMSSAFQKSQKPDTRLCSWQWIHLEEKKWNKEAAGCCPLYTTWPGGLRPFRSPSTKVNSKIITLYYWIILQWKACKCAMYRVKTS